MLFIGGETQASFTSIRVKNKMCVMFAQQKETYDFSVLPLSLGPELLLTCPEILSVGPGPLPLGPEVLPLGPEVLPLDPELLPVIASVTLSVTECTILELSTAVPLKSGS